MQNLTSLFLSQSYQDTWTDYMRSLTSPDCPVWDYVLLTAADENQAEGYRAQLQARRTYLPNATQFAVLPDEGGVRVGSGGATLSALKYVYEQEQRKTGRGHFEGLRILVIHSGGDSKRVPTYSALGKLFSPVPHMLPDGRASTLFEELMIVMTSVASRVREGMVLLSGDVLLLFNPLQIDFPGRGAAAISFQEAVETGKNHGVFLNGDHGNVRKFLHKQTAETLRTMGAVNEKNCVDIDTGAVIFAPDLENSLYSLVDTEETYRKYVNDRVRLSLYGDFLYPMAEDSTLDAFYEEKPEGTFCPELREARTAVWQALRPHRMKLLRLAPAKFIHFGTTGEILALMSGGVDRCADLGWSHQVNSSISGPTAGYNSVVSEHAELGEGCYLEGSFVHGGSRVGSHVLLSHLDLCGETVPDEVVLHGLRQKDGSFVCRIYGVADNPKENVLFGAPLETLCFGAEQLWKPGTPHTLWEADLYPACSTIREAVTAALNVYALARGAGDLETWKCAERTSLHAGVQNADVRAMIDWDDRMAQLVQMEAIRQKIQANRPASQLRPLKPLTKIQTQWLEHRLEHGESFETIQLLYYIGAALGPREGSASIRRSFEQIASTIANRELEHLQYHDRCRMVCDRHVVRLPLRVNFGGGWSDTPPICCMMGGTILNAAIRLNGRLPVEVTLQKIPQKKLIFDSRDMDVHGEFDTIEALQDVGDPYDAFVLQKACLLACGIIPRRGGNLEEILTRLGGGFELHSEVTDVPKGSGLGTSSILAAACVKAVLEFMGIPYTEAELYQKVLCMEQLMSTGGGWQDQVGGLTGGIKYITSKPGIRQELQVQPIHLSDQARKEFNERFCLIYTGQRRLARRLLRDVVGRFLGNEPGCREALDEVQRVALLMRFALEREQLAEFAALMERHWALSKRIDRGSTNTLIEQIFASVDDLIDGRMICGAGGGGFLQVFLKKNVNKQQVHQRLKDVFRDNPVDVWDAELIEEIKSGEEPAAKMA